MEGITRLSCGEVCPSSGAGTPPHPGRAGGSPQSAFVPALERMDWRQPDRLSAGDTRDPAGQAEGRGTGGGRIDGGNAGLWRDPFLCQPGGCGISSPSWGPAPSAHTVPAPWMQLSALEMLTQHLGHSSGSWLPLVPGSPGSDVRTPWDWHGPWALCAGDGKLEKQILQQASQVGEASMACRKRNCRIWAASVHSDFVEFPVLLSYLLSEG